MVDWLSDLSWVPNGSVVLISCNAAPGSKRGSPPPRTTGSAASPAVDVAVNGDTPAVVGEGEVPEQAEKDVEEDEEEVLALAALSRIRESYKMRSRGRRSEMGRVETGESADEAGLRMAEARSAKEGTAQFRKVSGQRVVRVRSIAWLPVVPMSTPVCDTFPAHPPPPPTPSKLTKLLKTCAHVFGDKLLELVWAFTLQ